MEGPEQAVGWPTKSDSQKTIVLPTEAITGLLQTKNTLSFSDKDQEGSPDAAATGLLRAKDLCKIACQQKDSQESRNMASAQF